MVFRLGFEYCEWRASKSLTPVGEFGPRRGRVNDERHYEIVQGVRWYSRKGGHGGNNGVALWDLRAL